MTTLQREKIRKTLKTFGLTPQETNVYIEMIAIGTVPVTTIAKRLKITRSTIRYTLEKLVSKRLLVQSKKNNTYYFTPEDPEKLIGVLREKKSELDYQESAIKEVLPDLKSLQNPLKNIPKVRYFEGEDGLIAMYEDVLKDIEVKPMNIFSYAKVLADHVYPEILNYLKNTYVPRRKAVGNKAYMILPSSMQDSEYMKPNKSLQRTCAYVPDDQFDFITGYHIYGNKVAHYFQNQQDQMGGILIENSSIAQDQKQLFRLAWDHALTFPENQRLESIPVGKN